MRTCLEREGEVGVAPLLEGLEADEPREEEERAGSGAPRQGGRAAAAEVAQHAAGQHGEPVGDREAEVVHLWGGGSRLPDLAARLLPRCFLLLVLFSPGASEVGGRERDRGGSRRRPLGVCARVAATGSAMKERVEQRRRGTLVISRG